MARQKAPNLDACPFIDDDDPRCADHFKLEHLSDAFRLCIGGYRGCPTFYRLQRQQPQRLITLTAHGQPLQPTGT
ncbi:MAG: hypothetical protein GC159_09325 [Phycisphaera sp.]|nr:hypothetical protein [Phycisphaera sp.]